VARSLLVMAVLRCLAEHPHDDSVPRIASRLGEIGDPPAVEAALTVLHEGGLVTAARGHFALTRDGWTEARRAGADPDEL
jgi:DNA-binding transcriptional ArsR family regulator